MPDDVPDDTNAAPRWIDAFPWIEAAVASSGNLTVSSTAWWLETIDPSDRQRGKRLADLSELALECLAQWTIGQIFPALPAGAILNYLPMTNRAKNALERVGYQTTGDLQGLELGDVLDLPYVGVGTVGSILQALAGASTLTPASAMSTPTTVRIEPSPAMDAQQGEPTGAWAAVADDLQTVAGWYVTIGLSTRPLFGGELPPGCPPDVIKARQRLEMVTAGDVLYSDTTELDATEILQSRMACLDERGRLILAKRLFADKPMTLDELGQDLGLTRERVRQIETKARASLVEELEPGKQLRAVCDAVRDLAGVILPLADLLAQMPALAGQVEVAGQPTWRVLDRLDGSFEIKDGWCAVPTILSAQNETMTRLQEVANPHGVIRLSDLGSLNPNQSEASATASLREWVTYCGWLSVGDHVLTRIQSVGDRAAAILSIAGSPMPAQDILDRFDVERSLVSLRNAMGVDDRFARVDRDKWALAEWGLESYSGIKAVIRDEIARHGGQILLDAMIERITARYTVSASSVATYASAPPFETRDGVVRLAAGDRNVRKGPERTRRMYRRPDAWLYRITVTKEHLRGSGFPAPVAVAAIMGLQPGQVRELDSSLGPQVVNWTGSQPGFGSILRFLVDSDVGLGSEVFLIMGDDGSFRIEPIGLGVDRLECALQLAGATGPAARDQPRAALAAAIGLPEDSPPASVIGGYRERGDTDIADLLVSVRDRLEVPTKTSQSAQSADIDEILDLL